MFSPDPAIWEKNARERELALSVCIRSQTHRLSRSPFSRALFRIRGPPRLWRGIGFVRDDVAERTGHRLAARAARLDPFPALLGIPG